MAFAPLAGWPKWAYGVLHEVSRHLLRRPVVGIAALVRVPDGRYVLVRRADTGTWTIPGGTLEWGETLRSALVRELEEEAGVTHPRRVEIVGVFSEPKRDLRFHAVTVIVRCEADPPEKKMNNPLEIREVGLFEAEDFPRPLAMGFDDVVDRALAGERDVLE